MVLNLELADSEAYLLHDAILVWLKQCPEDDRHEEAIALREKIEKEYTIQNKAWSKRIQDDTEEVNRDGF